MFGFILDIIKLGFYTTAALGIGTSFILYKTVPEDKIDESFLDKCFTKKEFKNYVLFKTCRARNLKTEKLLIGALNNWVELGEGVHGSIKYF